MIRNHIWATLVNLKFKGYVLGFLINRFQIWDRNISIFLAFTSSGSIATWLVWQTYPILWAAIIAASQVISVIKAYFPFYKYTKELNTKCYRVDNLNIEFERLWNNLQRKKITEDVAEELYYDYKKQITEIFNFSDDIIFTVGKKITNKANKKMVVFLKTSYGI